MPPTRHPVVPEPEDTPVTPPVSTPLVPAPRPCRDGWRHLVRLRQALRAGTGGDRPNAGPRRTTGSIALPGQAVLLGASGAALALASRMRARGLQVTIIESDTDAAVRLRAHLTRLGAEVSVTDDPARLSGAGLVIDTCGEADPGPRLTAAIAQVAPEALLAGLIETGGALSGPDRLVALRLVAPASGLVEVMARSGHDPEANMRANRQAAGVAHALGCLPVQVPAGAEGAGARLLARLEATAEALAFAGAPAWDLDAAAEALGFAQGPCALMDRLGVDSALPRRARLTAAGMDLPDPGVIARMVAEGRLGRRASVGWFRYPGGGGQVTDPLIEDLVREEAWFARRTLREFDLPTLGRHLLAALIDEAARLLDEGAVAGPSDVDLGAVLALGFPPGLGGPVWLADHWGASAALAAVEALRDDLDGLPGVPQAAPALRRAARSGQPLGHSLFGG